MEEVLSEEVEVVDASKYLLHNELHYNGLMTDWGLSLFKLQFVTKNRVIIINSKLYIL